MPRKKPTQSPSARLREFASKVTVPPTSLLATAHVSPSSLRVWWHPHGTVRKFTVPVATIQQARTALRTLTSYDEFRREGTGSGGLEVYSPDGWCEWHNADGNDIRWVMAQAEAV